ncbi:nucleotidyltransferase substrate binding protein [Belliella pelovolcani]|uniref:Nucleotidyltransferase substrate binding protein, HI0074 family n=1 Tax=Belliella pelovolcani TaxID=529505 RepID=A0A1N7P228_9BACT|nr:nucleotidyltransferase substrate binding protein [Belliella pelovolcani]SIT04631.1 nucleotidyltransferase substrate binding protein, HI0074 family [Belliella pelovolcani]
MQESNSRWQQRFSNYKKALAKLDQAVTKIKEVYKIDEEGRVDKDDFLDDILKEGLIQRFEYTHELAWNVMKDFLKNSGNTEIYGSKDATREAFSAALISNGEVWMDMIKSRNKTSHTYNEETADDIFMKVIYEYFEEFVDFRDKMEALDSGQQGKIW